MTGRFAVYFCPSSTTALYEFGATWLGRDPRIPGPEVAPEFGLDEAEWMRVTGKARMYGFHATLKPPFVLADGHDRSRLCSVVRSIARSVEPLRLSLTPSVVSKFIALVPSEPKDEVAFLANRCVAELDAFRQPAAPEELTRRKAGGLTLRQEAMLRRWGYPYVFDEYRFHMTLSDPLDAPEQRRIVKLLAPHLVKACRNPATIEDLCLFEQAAEDSPFVLTERFHFVSGRSRDA